MCRAQQVGARRGVSALCDGFLEGGLCAARERPSHCLGGRWVSNPISGEISLLLLLQMWQMKSTMLFTGTAGRGFSATYVLKYQRCFLCWHPDDFLPVCPQVSRCTLQIHWPLAPVLAPGRVSCSKTLPKVSKAQTLEEPAGPWPSQAEPAFHCRRASNAPSALLQLLDFSALWLHHPAKARCPKPSRF